MNFLTGLSATLLVMVVAGGDVKNGSSSRENCHLANNVEMGSLNIFEPNTAVDSHAKIGSKNIFGRRSKVGHHAVIKSNNKFGSGLHMDHHATIGDGNSIGNYVRMLPHSKVLDNTKIDGDSILDENSIVGSRSQIGSEVYLGKHSLAEGVKIGKRAVVHAYVELSQGATVGEGEIVIPSPSSFELFQQCARFDKLPRNSTSRDINVVLSELINAQFEILNDNCKRGMKRSAFETMPLIKSLYLIKYYGKEGFKSKYREVSEISSAGGLNVQFNEMGIDDSNTGGESSSSSTVRNAPDQSFNFSPTITVPSSGGGSISFSPRITSRPVAANTIRTPGGGSTTRVNAPNQSFTCSPRITSSGGGSGSSSSSITIINRPVATNTMRTSGGGSTTRVNAPNQSFTCSPRITSSGGGSSSSSVTIINRPVAANTVRRSSGGGSTTGGNHELYNEFHFVENAQQDILNPEVKLKFVQALAAELDAKRYVRIQNDSFCSMIEQIQSGARNVTCGKRRSNIL